MQSHGKKKNSEALSVKLNGLLCAGPSPPSASNHLAVSLPAREAIWGACVSALSTVPRLLRMLLQSMQVDDLSEDELPQLGRILCTLLQHVPLHSQLLANSHLLQEIIQQLTVGKDAAAAATAAEASGKRVRADGGAHRICLLPACLLQRYSRGGTRQQWLTDLLYYYSVAMAHSSSARRGNLGGLRDMY